MCAAIVVAFAVMVVVECVLCNMPFWRSLAASGDSAAAYNVLGPGLERTDEGLLKVTDPTQAYMQVDADGSSEYVRMDPVSSKALDKAVRQSEQVLRTVRVRPDVNRRAGTVSSVSVSSPRSLYVHAAAAGGSVCVRIVEPKGSLIPFDAVRANVRVPFALNPLRIGVMVAVLAMVLVWRPGSRLWRMPLDTTSVRQRAWLGALLAVPVVVTCAVVVWQLVEAAPLSFHTKGTYTYDFDQYDYVARALLDGHAWLDLDVPDALRDAADPYDVATRQRLLADGVSPVYWDYAFYQGHWYSYFGVVPALLLFLPYRAVTSLSSMAADDALRCGRAAADAWFSGIRMSAGDSCDIPNSSECAVGCGQYAVRVHAVGFQWFVSVVSDEFLFGADRRLPVSERVGIVAVVGRRQAGAGVRRSDS